MDSLIAIAAVVGLLGLLFAIGSLVEGDRPSKPRLPKRFRRTVGQRR